MIVKHTKDLSVATLKLDDINIGNVHQYEYIGMLYDAKLTMNNYVDFMGKKVNTKIGILAKIRRFVS